MRGVPGGAEERAADGQDRALRSRLQELRLHPSPGGHIDSDPPHSQLRTYSDFYYAEYPHPGPCLSVPAWGEGGASLLQSPGKGPWKASGIGWDVSAASELLAAVDSVDMAVDDRMALVELGSSTGGLISTKGLRQNLPAGFHLDVDLNRDSEEVSLLRKRKGPVTAGLRETLVYPSSFSNSHRVSIATALGAASACFSFPSESQFLWLGAAEDCISPTETPQKPASGTISIDPAPITVPNFHLYQGENEGCLTVSLTRSAYGFWKENEARGRESSIYRGKLEGDPDSWILGHSVMAGPSSRLCSPFVISPVSRHALQLHSTSMFPTSFSQRRGDFGGSTAGQGEMSANMSPMPTPPTASEARPANAPSE
ncbi:hypothetical protein BDK51DRAFT_38341 [Blyttiomyces helicus]|uniref:Uncharacterized protein n=1 Tax=Blyttiomyces helicus TaxID=388810 RepID=A0A4P9WCV3_9FUNG|nr:hypothetical protein BDK51DRAFT_38341 [Blyttiomyces helicus]|eukprot:RKO90344.1 hypothetical protein BDK51DRAFT_38341 [Blyttiomyces helicus]